MYNAVSILAKENGTTVEQMVAEFICCCAAKETRDEAARQIEQWAKDLQTSPGADEILFLENTDDAKEGMQ